jgi:hypothetical protein
VLGINLRSYEVKNEDLEYEMAKRSGWHLACRQWSGERYRKSGPQNGAISAVLVRIAYRCGALQMKIFPHYRERQDGCMIASVLEVKKGDSG